ncbi:hypothetical protein CPLU01_09175 [Colletotrichum plurivorum]|uniref:Uncharacterized protein n=1 Tax=Colletotrichum plurivorum TaxID=2175906 RepID=A0A8H6NC06_9PEZI|nr:hypothetical protein CPLU01_09175 [Colletotrichum plurivorum]
MLNNHHDYETIRNLLKHARFRSWAVPNLRFDRYVLKTDKEHASSNGIDAYLRNAMVLLAMKQLWDNNQYLEWQPDIHPAAIRQAVAPCQRRRLVARFFCGPQKCKVFQGPAGDVSVVDDKSTMRRVRFAEPQEDPRRDFKLYPLRKMTKQYGLSMHTVKRLTAFMHQRANIGEASHL